MSRAKVIEVEPLLMSTSSVAKYLDVSECYIRDHKSEFGPLYQIGKGFYFEKAHVDKWVKRNRVF